MTNQKPLAVTLHIDGASKGNPGHAGIGILVRANGEVLTEHADYLGRATNNAAEYQALLKGLDIATSLGAEHVSVISDSELVVKQINGLYRVKNVALLPLYQEARKRSRKFKTFQIQHVPRAENREADRLANEGIWKGQQASKKQV